MGTRTPLLFSIVLGAVSALSCPPQYQLMEGRCIRPITLSRIDYLVRLMPKCQETCRNDGAHLPIIRNNEENNFFNNITNTFAETEGENIFLVLGLVCNETTTRLQWEDGTRISYVPSGSGDMKYNCVNSPYMVTSAVFANNWNRNAIDGLYAYSCFCVAEAIEELAEETTTLPSNHIDCGDYSQIENGSDKPCFKVFTDPLSWEDAQSQCASESASLIEINSAEENEFFWRTAVTNNILGGMHIGARQSSKSYKNWSWIDGKYLITGNSYDNFIGSFPIPGAGECASMATESVVADWVNVDCKDNQLPYICRRAVLPVPIISSGCPKDAPKAGDDFFPPGYPNSDIACEYFLNVNAGKLVELEILALAAGENVDFLEIYEGSSGLNLLANLTGHIDTPTKITTSKSNVLRVNWKPKGTGDGRGFRILYYEVVEDVKDNSIITTTDKSKEDVIITTTNKGTANAIVFTAVAAFLIMLSRQ